MQGLVRVVLCSFFLVLCSPLAFADSVSVTGNVSFTPDSLTFAPPFATQTNSGVFSAFSGGTVNYFLGTVSYIYGIPQTEEAFTITNTNGDVLAFWDEVNSPSKSFDANGNLDVTLDETGYYTINGGPALAGTFDLGLTGNTPNGSLDNVAFLGTGSLTEPYLVGVAPEPGSILLMGTGLLLCSAFLYSRRKPSTASLTA